MVFRIFQRSSIKTPGSPYRILFNGPNKTFTEPYISRASHGPSKMFRQPSHMLSSFPISDSFFFYTLINMKRKQIYSLRINPSNYSPSFSLVAIHHRNHLFGLYRRWMHERNRRDHLRSHFGNKEMEISPPLLLSYLLSLLSAPW